MFHVNLQWCIISYPYLNDSYPSTIPKAPGFPCCQPGQLPGQLVVLHTSVNPRFPIGNGYQWIQLGVEPKIWENPPNHPFVHRVWNHYKPSILGVFPLFLETPSWIQLLRFFFGGILFFFFFKVFDSCLLFPQTVLLLGFSMLS